MSGLTDTDAVLADFEAFLVQDGRQSHGTDYLTRKLAELRAKHRVDESHEAATLRHFSGYLTDIFLGLVPNPATSDPLASDDLRASVAMVDGATVPSPSREASCLKQQKPSSRRTPVSSLANGRTERSAAPTS